MNALEFLTIFLHSVDKEAPYGYGSEWKTDIYRVLERVGRMSGYMINNKQTYGEIDNTDFFFFSRARNAKWHPPAVVLEHENSWNVEETRKDFWKCCLYAAPLRVTIGYMATEHAAVEPVGAPLSFLMRGDRHDLVKARFFCSMVGRRKGRNRADGAIGFFAGNQMTGLKAASNKVLESIRHSLNVSAR